MHKETLNLIKAAEHELFINQTLVQEINHQITLTEFLSIPKENITPNLKKLNEFIPNCKIINLFGQPVLSITKYHPQTFI